MKMIDHNHFICHLILGTFTEYPLFDVMCCYIGCYTDCAVSCITKLLN